MCTTSGSWLAPSAECRTESLNLALVSLQRMKRPRNYAKHALAKQRTSAPEPPDFPRASPPKRRRSACRDRITNPIKPASAGCVPAPPSVGRSM